LSASSNHFAIFLLKSYPKKEKEKQWIQVLINKL
jgi:hypothetical protein